MTAEQHMDKIVETGVKKAVEVLEKDSTPYGFLASAAGYLEVWARDSCVTLLGADLTGNKKLIKTSERALNTLGRYQSELGQIPNNVKPPKMSVDFGEAGSTDATLWYIIGVYYHYRATGDEKFLTSSWPSVQKGISWARYQDCNNCGLIEVPESGDWADLFSNYHNVLYDEVLYYGALRAYVAMAKERKEDFSKFRSLADDVKRKVNLLMWVDGLKENEIKRTNRIWLVVHNKMNIELGSRPYYLPYVSFRDFGQRCDVYANLLAVIFDIADK
ncbi:MAG TPA: GH116 family glycosyl hydrolase, partial [archaeon]|nr:GH116 family glycosyl hydrolase [archaeon]